MQPVIHDPHKDPLGMMMLDYLQGDRQAFVEVDSTSLKMSTMTGRTMFRQYDAMGLLEQQALGLCRGKVLDVGAGSGCHTLFLRENGIKVDALDISPGCIETMEKRQVEHPVHDSVFHHDGFQYDTILMLMNGLGLCGTIDGLNLFLQYIPTILRQGGQVLADSIDLAALFAPEPTALSADNNYHGETEFIISYRDIVSDPFPWLYIDFPFLQTLVHYNELQCEQLAVQQDGQYLVRIF